jgi:hypothetical protein
MLPSGSHVISHNEIDFCRSNEVMGISEDEDSIPPPYRNSVTGNYDGANINTAPLDTNDNLLVPCFINLEIIGLWRSPRLAALNQANDLPAIVAYSTSTMPLSSRQIMIQQPRLSFLSVFNSVGSLWTFATTNSHTNDDQFSFAAHFSNDFDQLNGLFDDTINEICHQIHAYTMWNECFTYSQMLFQDDHKQFF